MKAQGGSGPPDPPGQLRHRTRGLKTLNINMTLRLNVTKQHKIQQLIKHIRYTDNSVCIGISIEYS